MKILNSNAIKDNDTEEVKRNKKKEIKFHANEFLMSLLCDLNQKKSKELIDKQSNRYLKMLYAINKLFKTRLYEK